MRVADKQRAEKRSLQPSGGEAGRMDWPVPGTGCTPTPSRNRAGRRAGVCGLTLIAAKPTQMPSTWPATRWLLRRSTACRLDRAVETDVNAASGNLFVDVSYGSLREDVGYP